MGSGKIDVSRLRKQDIGEFFIFREKVFPKNNKQLDQKRWEWLFMKNPAAENIEPQTWVLRDDGHLVGTISNIPLRVKVAELEVVCSFGSDYFVDKKYLGLPALRLLKTMQKQCDINVGANLSASATKLFSKMGYSNLSANLRAVSTFFPANATKASLRSLLKFHFNNSLRQVFCPKKYSSIILENLPESVNKLWGKVTTELPVSVVKDYGYLRWRYEECPSVNYRFVVLEHKQQIAALAVVTVQKDTAGEKKGLISDILVDQDNASATCGIIHATLDFFQSEGCISCFTELLHDRSLRFFRLMGFNTTKSNLGLMVLMPKRHNQDLRDLTDPAKWAFYVGDTDRY